LLRSVRLDEASEPAVEAAGTDLRVNFSGYVAPFLHRSIETEFLGALDGSVECDPCHHLRVGEVLSIAADFPDSFVGFAPDLREMAEKLSLYVPTGFGRSEVMAACVMERIHYLPEYVQLQLP